MKIIAVLGARPQFIKASVVSAAANQFGRPISPYGKGDAAEIIVSTLARDLGAN